MNKLLMTLGGWQTIVDVPIWLVWLTKITAILLVAWAIYFTLKRTNPRWRILLWRATAVSLLVLPLAVWLFPALNIYVEKPIEVSQETVKPAVAEVAAHNNDAGTFPIYPQPQLHATDFSFDPLREKSNRLSHETPSRLVEVLPEAPSPEEASSLPPVNVEEQSRTADSSTPVPPVPTMVASRPVSVPWNILLSVLWLGGVLVLGLRLCWGHCSVLALVNRARPAPQAVCEEGRLVAESIGCRRAVCVIRSKEISSPFVFGFLRPRLLLPERMCRTSYRDDLGGILAHELTHVRSRDVFWNICLQVISIFLWFHPLVWRMRKAHLAACELASDAASANYVGDVSGYCRTLARVAVYACGALPASGIAMARTSMIMHRLNRLKERVFHLPLRRRSVIGFGMAMLLAVTVLGVLQFAFAEPAKEDPVKEPVAESAKVEQPRISFKLHIANVPKNSEMIDQLPGGGVVLDKTKYKKLLDEIQGDRRANLMQAPKVTTKVGTAAFVSFPLGLPWQLRCQVLPEEIKEDQTIALRIKPELIKSSDSDVPIKMPKNWRTSIHANLKPTEAVMLGSWGELSEGSPKSRYTWVVFLKAELADKADKATAKKVGSQAVEKTSTPFVVTLPNGTKVEVVGVCEHPSAGKKWWKPDGSPLEKPPYDSTKFKERVSPREGKEVREVACRVLPGKKDGSRFAISCRHVSGGSNYDPLKAPDGSGVIRPQIIEVEKSQPICSVRVHYSTDKWTDHVVTRKGDAFVSEDANIVESKASEAKGTTSLTFSHKMIDLEVRVVAIDLDGRQHKCNRSNGYDSGDLNLTTALFYKLPLAKIKEFRLQSRPRRWVELRNVSLQPGHKTQAEVARLEDLSPEDIEAANDRAPQLVDFTSLSYSITPPWGGQPQKVVVKSNGTCIYSAEKQPARGGQKERPGEGCLNSKLSPEKLRQLEHLLQKTDWLTAPGGEGPAMHTDGAAVKLVLHRKGKNRSIECLGQRPEPYKSLLWFFEGLARQENRVYCLRWYLDHSKVCDELVSEIEALQGASGRMPLYNDIDYTRYLFFFDRALQQSYNATSQDVVTAVHLVHFLGMKSKARLVAKLANDRDDKVRVAVARALVDLDGPNAAPVLAGMVDSTEEARRCLVCMGSPAVPAIAAIISQGDTGDNRDAEHLVRAYIDHWPELPGPIDPRIIDAVRKGMQKVKEGGRTEYYKHFLKLVESDPVPVSQLSCRLNGTSVFCPTPVRFIHGWYVVDGNQIVRHGTLPAPDAGTKVFNLQPQITPAEDRFELHAIWRTMLPCPGGQTGKSEKVQIEGPPGSKFEMVYAYNQPRPYANGTSAVRITEQGRTLFEGRFVKDGQVVRRVFYVAKVVRPDDPTRQFEPPAKPAPMKNLPENPVPGAGGGVSGVTPITVDGASGFWIDPKSKPNQPGSSKSQPYTPVSSAAAISQVGKPSAPKSLPVSSITITGVVVDQQGQPEEGVEVKFFGYTDYRRLTMVTKTDKEGRFRFYDPNLQGCCALHARTSDGARQTYRFIRSSSETDSPLRMTMRPAQLVEVSVSDGQGKPIAGATVAAFIYPEVVNEGRSDAQGKCVLRVPADHYLHQIYAQKPGQGFDYVSFRSRAPGYSSGKLSYPTGKTLEVPLTLDGVKTARIKLVDPEGKPVEGIKVCPVMFTKKNDPIQEDWRKFLPISVGERFCVKTDADGVAVFDCLPAWCTTPFVFMAESEDRKWVTKNFAIECDPNDGEKEVTKELVRAIPLRGQLRYPDGNPGAGIEIEVHGLSTAHVSFYQRVQADEQGRFEFRLRPDSAYMLVSKDQHWVLTKSPEFFIKDKPIKDLDLRLQPATKIHGHVTVGPKKEPMSAKFIRVVQKGPDLRKFLSDKKKSTLDRTGTDTEVNFLWLALVAPDGSYQLAVGPGDYELSRVGTYYGVSNPLDAAVKKLSIKNEKTVQVDFHEDRCSEGPLYGKVVLKGDSDKPVADAEVVSISCVDSRIYSAVTDSEGKFYVERRYQPTMVYVTSKDGRLAGMVQLDGEEIRVTIPLQSTTMAEGRLLDASTGKPLADRELQYHARIDHVPADHKLLQNWSMRLNPAVKTDADGRFKLPGLVVGTEYNLYVLPSKQDKNTPRILESFEKLVVSDAKPIQLGDLKARIPDPNRRPYYAPPMKQVDKPSVKEAKSATEKKTPPKSETAITGVVVGQHGQLARNVEVELGSGAERHVTKTDAQGGFRFSMKDFRSGSTLRARTADSARQAYYRFPWTNDVASSGVRPIRLTMRPARVVEVSVHDGQGKPLAGATVGIVADCREMDQGRSDAEGKCVLRMPADVELRNIYALKSGQGVDYVAFPLKGMALEKKDDTSKESDENEKLSVALKLDGAKTVRIKLVDPEGKPVEGLKVSPGWFFKDEASLENCRNELSLSGVKAFHVKTDADGVAAFDWFPVWQTSPMAFWKLADKEKTWVSKRIDFDPSEGKEELTVSLVRTVPLRGQVRFPDGSPAAGVQVHGDGSGRDSTTTDAEGRFLLHLYSNGNAMLVVKDPCWALSEGKVVLLRDKPVEDIVLKLQPATKIYGRMTVGPNKEPFAGKTIRLEQRGVYHRTAPEDGKLPNQDKNDPAAIGMFSHSTTTDDDGRYEFLVGPGEYTLYGSRHMARQKFTITEEKSKKLDFHAPRPERGLLTGRVVLKDDPTQTVPGVKIRIMSRALLGGESLVTSDDQGRFRAERGLHRTLIYAYSKDKRLARMLEIAADDKEVTIPLQPTVSIEGRLLHARSKKPVANREIQCAYHYRHATWDGKPLTMGSSCTDGSTKTDADGRFKISGLAVGAAYQVTVPTPEEGEISSQNVKEFTAKDSKPIEFGNLYLRPPYRPPTHQDRIDRKFGKAANLSSQLDRALQDAQLTRQRVLVVFIDPKSEASNQLFKLYFEDEKAQNAFADYRLLGANARKKQADRAKAFLQKQFDIKSTDSEKPRLLILDTDGKLLAAQSLDQLTKAEKIDRELLIQFLKKHALQRPDAEKILGDALARAKKENKRVLVQETGAYCGWCIVLSRFLQSQQEILSPDYVIVKIDRHRFRNGKKVMGRIRKGKKDYSIPWMAILDAEGKVLITSDGPEGNIGHPGEPDGADHFIKMLSTTAQRITPDQLAAIRAALIKPPKKKETKPVPEKKQGTKAAKETEKESARKAKTMRVRILGPDGKPLSGAKLHACIWTKEKGFKANRDYKTDAEGFAEVKLPKTCDIVRLWASKKPFVTIFAHWEAEYLAGKELPKEYTIYLENAVAAGGRIVDEEGKPVVGAKVKVREDGGTPRKSDGHACYAGHLATGSDTAKTDAEGRWRIENVPDHPKTELMLLVTHPDFISDEFWGGLQNEVRITTKMLLNETATLTLKRGVVLVGQVTDPEGKPIKDAIVVQGDDPYGSNIPRKFVTDADGRYRVPALKPQELALTAMAPGFAPQRRMVKIESGMAPQDFQMAPGKPVELRFVDTQGKPIPKVKISIQEWQGSKSIGSSHNPNHPKVPSTKIPLCADENGVWRWNSAPEGPIMLYIYKKGFAPRDKVKVAVGDAPKTITLKGECRITGQVTDAVTGKPIPVFGIIPIDVFRKNWLHAERFNARQGKNGRLDYLATRTDIPLRLQIEAMGYRTQLGPEYRVGGDGPRIQNFRLQPSKPISGVVLGTDGQPAKGVEVTLATPTEEIELDESHNNHRTFTDAKGRFAFPDPGTPVIVVAQSKDGFVRADFPADRHDVGSLRLQPWASVSGHFYDNGKPVEKATILLFSLSPRKLDEPKLDGTMQVRTDETGRFEFTRVPPGPVQVRVHLGPWRDADYRSGPSVPLDLKPGEHVELNEMGKGGTIVEGKVKLTGSVPKDIECNYSLNYLVRREKGIESPVSIDRKKFDICRYGWQGSWMKAPEGDDYLRTLRYWFVKLKPDGSFRVSGVPAGEYDLVMQIYEKPEGCLVEPVAERVLPITITEEDIKRGTLTLPDVKVKVQPGPKVGSTPSLEFHRPDGGRGSLADFRGRYTVVHFWAGFCGTCKEQFPALKKLHEQKADSKPAMLGLAVYDTPESWKASLEKLDLPWPQGRVDSKTPVVSCVPIYWLLDPQGKLIGKFHHPKTLADELEKHSPESNPKLKGD